MINALRDQAIWVLLGIAVRIFENAVVDPHGEGSEVAGCRRNFNARVESSDKSSLKSTAAAAGDVDAVGVNIRTGQQVVDRTDAVPDFPSCQVRTGKVGEVAKDGVLRANQVIAAFAGLCVPELA